MLQGTVRQIKITPKFILHQNAKFSTRQYFRLYGTLGSVFRKFYYCLANDPSFGRSQAVLFSGNP